MPTFYYSYRCERSHSHDARCFLECIHCEATKKGGLYCDLHMMQKVV